jgi:hypothetical protein
MDDFAPGVLSLEILDFYAAIRSCPRWRGREAFYSKSLATKTIEKKMRAKHQGQHQGCQIFLGTNVPKREKYTKIP